MSEGITKWIVEWFRSRGKSVAETKEGMQSDYLQSGLLSSLEIVELVAAAEDRYGIQFTEAEMQDPRFASIGGLSELVAAAVSRDKNESRAAQSADAPLNTQTRVS